MRKVAQLGLAKVCLQHQTRSPPVPNAFVSITEWVSSSLAPNAFTFSIKHVPSLALHVFVSSAYAKWVISSQTPNAFASFVFRAKRDLFLRHKRLLLQLNAVVLGGECARLERQKRSFPTQKDYRWVLYEPRMLTTSSIQSQIYFGPKYFCQKKFIPYRPTRLFQFKTTINKKYFGSGLRE